MLCVFFLFSVMKRWKVEGKRETQEIIDEISLPQQEERRGKEERKGGGGKKEVR